MNLIQRVKDILLKPKDTWPVIEREPASTASLYTDYLLVLAAVPALCGFIGMSIIGVGGMGVSFRVPFFAGLVNMVVGYVLSLVAVFVLSLIVDALAPTFEGRKDPLQALKLVVFASTAGMLGGLFNLFPGVLSVLGLLAALYSIYLIYLGLPVLMKCPPGKAVGYTAVVIICGIVLGVVVSALAALVLPTRGLGGMAGMGGGSSPGGDVTVTLPGGEVKIDTAKMEAMAKKMEEAGKQMEAAQKSGDSAAAGKAMGDILGAMGSAGGAPLPPAELKALLPEALGALKRESVESQGGQAMGLAGSNAAATYQAGEQRVELKITDLGGLAGMAAIAGWANVTSDKETADGTEKTYKDGKRTVKESARKDGSRSELTVLLANGVVVEAEGRHVDLAALKGIVNGVGLDRLETMQRPAAPASPGK
jgi:Yip1 domain